MIVAIDTNVIVAALAIRHVRHEAAAAAIQRLADENTFVVPLHVLLESYSVLTRLPRPFRVAPLRALRALRESFGDWLVPGLAMNDVWPLLGLVANGNIAGARLYDIVIAHTARRAGAEAILTFNVRHFWGEGLQVLSP